MVNSIAAAKQQLFNFIPSPTFTNHIQRHFTTSNAWMFLSYLVCLIKELTLGNPSFMLPNPMLMKRLFADTGHLIYIGHFVPVLPFVKSEPVEGGVFNFFFKSMPNS